MHNKLALMLAVAGLAALVSAPAANAAWQDTGICDVPTVFATIQSAINEPGCLTVSLAATVTFREQVTIGRSLTLAGQVFQQGVETFVSTLRPPDAMSPPYALINVVGARTRLKVKHLRVEGPATGPGLIGIQAVRDTRVIIKDSEFRNIRAPQLNAQPGHVAMHLMGGPLLPRGRFGITGHSITNCIFEGYQNAAIVVEGVGITALIQDNVIAAPGAAEASLVRPAGTAAPTGVLVLDGAVATIDRNTLNDNSRDGGGGAAIVIQGAGDGNIVSFNNIDRNDLGVGIDATSKAKVYRNGLNENDTGMALGWTGAADAHTITLNGIGKGGTGLLLLNSSSNSISSNELENNFGGHGAAFSALAVKNKLYNNRVVNNGGFGFLDESRRGGTAGTANTYTSNICSGNGAGDSTPAGLCR